MPLTVTRSARIELPSAGAVICTLTFSFTGAVVVVALAFSLPPSEPPQAAVPIRITSAATTIP